MNTNQRLRFARIAIAAFAVAAAALLSFAQTPTAAMARDCIPSMANDSC